MGRLLQGGRPKLCQYKEVTILQTNSEPLVTVLDRTSLLIEHSPHSRQFQHLTEQMLIVFSAAAVIPALTRLEIRRYASLAALHDIGKRNIPQEILNKPGTLTAEEFDIVKTHTTQGCKLLEAIPELRQYDAFPSACDVCLHHHERWDGKGYPDGLAGGHIAPWVHVVGLADAFDALTHPRVYKPAYTPAQAREMILSGACGAFDPNMLECFGQHIQAIAHAVY